MKAHSECGDLATGSRSEKQPAVHNDILLSVLMDNGARRMVSCSWGRPICMWDAQLGNLVWQQLKRHKSPVWCVLISADMSGCTSVSKERVDGWGAATLSCETALDQSAGRDQEDSDYFRASATCISRAHSPSLS